MISSSSRGPMRWSEATALFGGTFDPPHLGHRMAVDGLFELPRVRAVRIIPSPTPPHKPTMAPAQHRAEMARLTFTEAAGPAWKVRGPVTLDLVELKRAQAQPAVPTYTFDTLSELRREIPQLAFVIGTDQLEKLHTWHRFPDVLGLSHWIVLERKDPTVSTQRAGAGQRVLSLLESSGLLSSESGGFRVRNGGTFIQVFATQAPALSSTQIRESLARHGYPPEDSMLPEARAYLMKHRLYGTGQLHNPGE